MGVHTLTVQGAHVFQVFPLAPPCYYVPTPSPYIVFLQGNQRGTERASIADEGYAASLSPTRIREGLRDMTGPRQKRAQVARQYDEALVKYLGKSAFTTQYNTIHSTNNKNNENNNTDQIKSKQTPLKRLLNK